MTRSSKVSIQAAIDLIKEFVVHFSTNKLPPYTSSVWKEMSKHIDGKWSAHNVYTNVREDRRGILTKARAELNISLKQKESCVECNESAQLSEKSEDEHEKLYSFVDSSFSDGSEILIEFDLILTEEDWDTMKPTELRGKRRRPCLMKGVWTNLISIALWQQQKLPCAFSFKRADVHSIDDTMFTIKIKGTCTSNSCKNNIYAYGEKRVNEKGLCLHVKTREVRNVFHEAVTRHLSGNRRREVQQELEAKGCQYWRRHQAHLHMKDGDIVPPFIPNNCVLQNAEKEKIDTDLDIRVGDGKDVIQTLSNLSMSSEFAGIITWTSMRPFFVFYYTPAQMNAYNDYCRIAKNAATISIDSTGSLVKKIARGDGILSGHVFLYSVVVNFEQTTLPVYQMLSEAHGTDLIEFWLKHWDRAGAPKPKQAVCDYSRALLASLCGIYNRCSVKEYVEWCFSIAVNDAQPFRRGVPVWLGSKTTRRVR